MYLLYHDDDERERIVKWGLQMCSWCKLRRVNRERERERLFLSNKFLIKWDRELLIFYAVTPLMLRLLWDIGILAPTSDLGFEFGEFVARSI